VKFSRIHKEDCIVWLSSVSIINKMSAYLLTVQLIDRLRAVTSGGQ